MSKSTISTFQLFEMFPDQETAREYLESRLWPEGPRCPVCGIGERITARKGGFYRCNQCKEDFTVRTGTIFERSHVPLHKWLYAMYLLVTARKGISSLQLSKEIGVTQKTAWFILHRLREACGKDLPKPDTDKKFGSNHRERAGRHSAKPSFYRDMIDAMTGGVPVLELFAREDDEHPLPPNFYTWGNQSKNTAEIETPHDADGVVIEETHQRPATTGKPSSAAAPHGEAAHAGTGNEMRAVPAGHSEGGGANAPATESEDEGEDLEIPPFLRRTPLQAAE